MPNYQGVWSLSTQYQNAGAWPSPPQRGIMGGGRLSSGATMLYNILTFQL